MGQFQCNLQFHYKTPLKDRILKKISPQKISIALSQNNPVDIPWWLLPCFTLKIPLKKAILKNCTWEIWDLGPMSQGST